VQLGAEAREIGADTYPKISSVADTTNPSIPLRSSIMNSLESVLHRQWRRILLAALVVLSAPSSQAQLINGNFETGDLSGWTLYNTSGPGSPFGDGQGGTAVAQAVLFDTAGPGIFSLSAQFEVGETAGPIGGGGLGQGAGIYQNVLLNAGQLNIALNIAASSSGNNGDAGTFRLLLDGNVVSSNAFGGINFGQTLRSTLSYAGAVAAGTHAIAVEMRRGGEIGTGNTPYQYLDDITIAGTAVPEPTTVILTFLGLGIFALADRRKRAGG
jgi:hypothetical protein